MIALEITPFFISATIKLIAWLITEYTIDSFVQRISVSII